MHKKSHEKFIVLREAEREGQSKAKQSNPKKRKVNEAGQQSLLQHFTRTQPSVTLKQTEFNHRLVDFVAFGLKPYSTVSDPYIDLTRPLAEGIDTLQGDKETFYGDLLPTLFTIKATLEALQALPTLGKLATVLLNRLVNHRFKNEFALEVGAKTALCAAISNPKYKTYWGSEEDIEKAMTIFKDEFDEVSKDSDSRNNMNPQPQTSTQRKGFIQLRTTPLAATTATSELARYLNDPRDDLHMLDDFPNVREIFFKTNTQLPTSAQVERMFNFAGILDHPNRNRILPVHFENNVVLKANSVFGREQK